MHSWMRAHGRLDLDVLMRHMMVLGFVALSGWALTATAGLLSERLLVSPQPTLRFLLAVLVLVFARRTYWQLLEWRWRRLPPDERFGFSSPLWDHPPSAESTDLSGTGGTTA